CQTRKAFSRHSSSHSGSFFLAEIIRTMSSLRPRGTSSASMSVTNPYLYSRVASSSMVSVLVDMVFCCRGLTPARRTGCRAHHALNESPHPHVLFAFGLL